MSDEDVKWPLRIILAGLLLMILVVLLYELTH